MTKEHRKEQETWTKQNNATSIFYKTGYGARGQQDVEGRMKKTAEEDGWGGDKQIIC